MSAGPVDFDPRHDLPAPRHETQPAPEVLSYEVQHVVGLDQGTEVLFTGVTASPERHLFLLNDERGCWEVFEVPDVVVVEVGEHHIRHTRAVDAERLQPFGGAEEMLPSSPRRYLGGKACVYAATFAKRSFAPSSRRSRSRINTAWTICDATERYQT